MKQSPVQVLVGVALTLGALAVGSLGAVIAHEAAVGVVVAASLAFAFALVRILRLQRHAQSRDNHGRDNDYEHRQH